MGVVIQRFEVYLVNLDPQAGHEIQKTRPGVIVSPDEMNRYIGTAIVASMTTHNRNFRTRVTCHFQGKEGQVVLDQLRTVDQSRLVKRLGRISPSTQKLVLSVLAEMFAA